LGGTFVIIERFCLSDKRSTLCLETRAQLQHFLAQCPSRLSHFTQNQNMCTKCSTTPHHYQISQKSAQCFSSCATFPHSPVTTVPCSAAPVSCNRRTQPCRPPTHHLWMGVGNIVPPQPPVHIVQFDFPLPARAHKGTKGR
jgi:hypothetical protein